MKRIIISFCLLITSSFIYGQALEGAVTYQKKLHPAAIVELPYTISIVNAALSDYLSKKGRSKGTDMKGFTTFRNTQLLANDSANADLYFKVEHKSRQDKERTILSLLLTTPKDSATNNLHYLNMDQAKTFLNNLVQAIDAYNLELQIKDQNDDVAKAESKYKNLMNEGADLEKKRASIEKQIQENKREQEAQQNEVEAQKQKLALRVNQRKA